MTRDDIIKLARDAGFYFHDAGYAPILHTTKNEYSEKCFERFAALVAAAEREACAKACEGVAEEYRGTTWGKKAEKICDNCADAIRARSNK